MAITLSITKDQIEAELRKAQPITPGWYEFTIDSVTPKMANDKASMNYVTVFRKSDDPERTIQYYFNSKPFGQTFIIKLFAAINNIPVQQFLDQMGSNFDLNFDNVKGKKVMCKVIHALGEGANAGKIYNNIEDWAPVGNVPF